MTDLQVLYDSFVIKVGEDFTEKMDLFIAMINPAIAKVYKQLRHGYAYSYDIETQTGSFNDDMDIDEIELIALQMAYDYVKDTKMTRLTNMQQMLGTKDFDKIPNLKTDMDNTIKNLEFLKTTISELKNDMNDYYGHS